MEYGKQDDKELWRFGHLVLLTKTINEKGFKESKTHDSYCHK